MNGNGDTLDLTRIRLTLGQSVAAFILFAGLIATGAVALDTMRTTRDTMELALKTLAMHSVELAVLDNRVQQVEQAQSGNVPRRAARHQSPNLDN